MALKRIIQRRFNHPFRGGRIGSEWVAALLRNAWPGWTGISGRNASEYAFELMDAVKITVLDYSKSIFSPFAILFHYISLSFFSKFF